MWVFCISAPPVFYLSTEDPSPVITMNAGEEEPGEGEKQDCTEETLALPHTLQLSLFPQAIAYSLPLKNQVSSLDIIHEVILPPPEGHLYS
ncbi:MAG: hypothetical protein P8Z38_06280 [Robiginitalea sp.]|jgi:hypothetical protein